MTTREFTISEHFLPRHWSVWGNDVDRDGYCLEYTFEEYARFSTLQEARACLELLQENYAATTRTLPEKE